MVSIVEGSEQMWADLEPFFFDEEEAVADHERRMRKKQEEASKQELRVLAAEAHKAVEDEIRDYDPKQGGLYYTRLHHHDYNTFDLNEESPLEPMRYTDKVYKKGDRFIAFTAVDFISLKIASLDIDFPIYVYGTVIARDCIDYKCVYLFQRCKDRCQLINSKDESLILTGPKRGLLLLDDAYVEVDLKIKDHEGQEDKELSKGILSIGGIANRRMDKCTVGSEPLATRLSTVEVEYVAVKDAVEATIEIEVLQGDFFGKITARTSSISKLIVLHDSKVAGVMTCDSKRVIHLLRRVVAVCREEKLEVIVAQAGDVKCESTIGFTPDNCGGAKGEITIGATIMLVKVAWSVFDNRF